MKSPEHWLVHDHTQFEVLFRQLHDAADISDWWAVDQYFSGLVEQLQYHMAQEEEVLFSAYDAKYDVTQMSSQVSTRELHNEHSVIVDKFRGLRDSIRAKQSEIVVDCIASLELLMIEHNKKEEQIFLPFASHLLFEDRDQLEQDLDSFVVSKTSRNWGL